MSEKLVDIRDLTIGYHTKYGRLVHVLRNVNLQIEPGETLGLVGESGCGKSTLGQAMMGFLRSGSQVLSGQVMYQGLDMFKISAKEMESIRGRRIALIPQNAGQSLTPTLRVGKQIIEALELNANIKGEAAKQRSVELLGQVQLPSPEEMATRYPHELSGGQQQRVAVAMALAGNPDMLVLDEPTTGLDVTTQAHILELLRDVVKEMGTAMMYISHDLGVIARVSDRISVMYAGEKVEDATASQLFKAPSHPYTRGLLESIPRLTLSGIPKSMPGQPPLPGTLPGCHFEPRCSFATDICREKSPGLESVSKMPDQSPKGFSDHLSRCHHWDKLATTDFSEDLKESFQDVRKTAATEPAITITDVDISYHRPGFFDKWLGVAPPPSTVAGINLTVNRGETVALVGESGSGKSTIVRTISGLLPAKGGSISFEKFDLTTDVDDRPRELQKRIQMIFQNPDASLNPRHSVDDILDQPLKLYYPEMTVEDRAARKRELLDRVRLDYRYLTRFPGQMSGGEKQRVAIARAFAADPEVVLCDEVTSALDVSVQAAVLDLLADLQKEHGTTYIFITHDLAVVRAFADRVAVLYQGRLCEVGTVDEIYAPPFHPYSQMLLGAALEPDPDMEPILMGGDTPESAPPAKGCPFQRRCPVRVGDICDNEMPAWTRPEGSIDHQIRCHIPIPELHIMQTTEMAAD
ncbi:MAG: peptide/nickel transport system ATP-binding protein [Cellvibrionaceae bacterium]|jgi:peptide/nickel transport system ATP-binding protein